MISRVGQSARKLRGLRRRMELVVLARVAARRGLHAWIVGGALRDRLLGAGIPEIDVAVSRDAEGLARELEAAGLGRAVFLSKDRPGPRVFRVAGPRPIDIAEIEGGSIAADLARRDFTVNAIAARARLRRARWTPSAASRTRSAAGCAASGPRISRRTRSGSSGRRGSGRRSASRRIRRSSPPRAPRRRSSAAPPPSGSRPSSPGCSAASGPVPRSAGPLARAYCPRPWAFRPAGRSPPRSPAGSPRWMRVRSERPRPARRRRIRLALIAIRAGMTALEARRWLAERRWAREDARDVVGPRPARRRERGGSLDRASGGAGSSMPGTSPRMRSSCSRAWASRAGGGPGPWLRCPGSPRAGSPWTATTSSGGSTWPPDRSSASCSRSSRVAAAMGEVKNRREARHWLTGQVRKAP